MSVYAAMLRYGEDQVTGHHVVATAHRLFPAGYVPAGPLAVRIAECELSERRKLLAFLREVPGPPTVAELLRSLCTNTAGIYASHRQAYYAGEDGYERLTARNCPRHGDQAPLQAGR